MKDICCIGHITKDKIVTPNRTVYMAAELPLLRLRHQPVAQGRKFLTHHGNGPNRERTC